ncbi:fucolectin-5-like isoform X3 [Macrobrachium nipponense]|uniref:fucolectin-5-like isoform X3 n=1 Tax=Macrobrachium nipponense TaxID=159736 RepID=UPI0030C8480A
MSSSANPFITVAAILAVLAVAVEPQGVIDILVVKQNELFRLVKGLETILNSIKNESVNNEQLELLNNKVDAGLETILNSMKNECVTNEQLELLKKKVDADFGVLGRYSQSLFDGVYLPANFEMPSLDFLYNIAQGKNTSSSSIYFEVTSYEAMMAIDDSDCTIFHSAGEIRPWWLIDLGPERVFYHILILGRQDCCSGRLYDLEIRLGNSLETPGNFSSFDLLNFFKGPYKKEDGFLVYTFPKGVKGRYLSLQIVADKEEYLQLATVKVIGLKN